MASFSFTVQCLRCPRGGPWVIGCAESNGTVSGSQGEIVVGGMLLGAWVGRAGVLDIAGMVLGDGCRISGLAGADGIIDGVGSEPDSGGVDIWDPLVLAVCRRFKEGWWFDSSLPRFRDLPMDLFGSAFGKSCVIQECGIASVAGCGESFL